jgi:hypothetical protein
MEKGGFYSRLASDEITTLFKVYNYHDSRACGY